MARNTEKTQNDVWSCWIQIWCLQKEMRKTLDPLTKEEVVIMSTMASQTTSLTIVYSTIHSGADQRKHQCSASLALVWGIHRWTVNSPDKGPVTRIMSPFDDVIMLNRKSWILKHPASNSAGGPFFHNFLDWKHPNFAWILSDIYIFVWSCRKIDTTPISKPMMTHFTTRTCVKRSSTSVFVLPSSPKYSFLKFGNFCWLDTANISQMYHLGINGILQLSDFQWQFLVQIMQSLTHIYVNKLSYHWFI